MKFISHRGNLNSKNPRRENYPGYIRQALEKGFDVEIDVWLLEKGKWYLGHDEPQYKIREDFLENSRLWCHAKNFAALKGMLRNRGIHCFWHDTDSYTITSKGYIWAYPGEEKPGCISVLPEVNNSFSNNVIGICSDYIESYRDRYRKSK